jgi:sulfotransferase family protein
MALLLARTHQFLACASLPDGAVQLTIFRYEDFVADPIGQTGILAKVLGVDAEQARIEEIVAAASPDSMREREKNGKKIDPKFNFIGPAKVGNWKQLHSGYDRDAISILEEVARDAMQRGGYESSAEAMDRFGSSVVNNSNPQNEPKSGTSDKSISRLGTHSFASISDSIFSGREPR